MKTWDFRLLKLSIYAGFRVRLERSDWVSKLLLIILKLPTSFWTFQPLRNAFTSQKPKIYSTSSNANQNQTFFIESKNILQRFNCSDVVIKRQTTFTRICTNLSTFSLLENETKIVQLFAFQFDNEFKSRLQL